VHQAIYWHQRRRSLRLGQTNHRLEAALKGGNKGFSSIQHEAAPDKGDTPELLNQERAVLFKNLKSLKGRISAWAAYKRNNEINRFSRTPREGEVAVRRHAERFGDVQPGETLYRVRSDLAQALDALPRDEGERLERIAGRVRAFAAARH